MKKYMYFVMFLSVFLFGCSDEQLDFTGKSPEQIAQAVKEEYASFKDVSMHAHQDGKTYFMYIKTLETYSDDVIKTSQFNIGRALENITKAKGNEQISHIVLGIYQIGVDKFNNESEELALDLVWAMHTLKQMNWKNDVQSYQLTDIAGISRKGYFGNNAIKAYCDEGLGTYREGFCKNIGYF